MKKANKTKIIFRSRGEIHPVRPLEQVFKEGEIPFYWKLRATEGTFLIFSEAAAANASKLIDENIPLHISGEIRVVSGGCYLVIKTIKKIRRKPNGKS